MMSAEYEVFIYIELIIDIVVRSRSFVVTIIIRRYIESIAIKIKHIFAFIANFYIIVPILLFSYV